MSRDGGYGGPIRSDLCDNRPPFSGVFAPVPQGEYAKRVFDRVVQQVLTTERGRISYDYERDEIILYLEINNADRLYAPFFLNEEVEEIWVVIKQEEVKE